MITVFSAGIGEYPSTNYPELEWLKGNDVVTTADYASKASDSEYKRTNLTLKCLNWILDGNYVQFTGQGKNPLRLEAFKELQQAVQELFTECPYQLTPDQLTATMRAALVLGDIGLSPKGKALFPELGHISDHDEFYKEALCILGQEPSRCPTFKALPLEAQNLLIKTSHFAHYGHICHVEGGPSMFSKIAAVHTPNDAYCLKFDLFIHCCDVAGAAGHVDDSYSIVYSNQVHEAMQAIVRTCQSIIQNGLSKEEGLMEYLRYRGAKLGLSADDLTERALIRVGCMLRLYTLEEGQALKAAADNLEQDLLEAFDPMISREGPTPTYMPAVLCNLKRHHNLDYAVQKGLPAIANTLKACPGELNFNPLAAQINEYPRCLESSETIEAFIRSNSR
ncbi:MAG: hypothetical protein KDK44_01810 [Chlamydiia bacterium]|nr:hypothetical protein [Chlamydiia bacterium]